MAHQRYNLRGDALPPSKLKRIKRATAERLLPGVFDRASAYNADATRLLRIERIKVFGSYLGAAPTLGDLDISLSHSRKPGWEKEASAQADAEAPEHFDWLQRLYWPEHDLKRKLRNSNGYISIHDEEEVDRLGCPTLIVFP